MDDRLEARIMRAARKLAASDLELGRVYALGAYLEKQTGHESLAHLREAIVRAHNIRQFELLWRDPRPVYDERLTIRILTRASAPNTHARPVRIFSGRGRRGSRLTLLL